MKFGLYVRPQSNMVLRLLDGKAEMFFMDPAWFSMSSEERFAAILAAPCRPARYNPHDPSWNDLLESRQQARFLYGVPDDVELYIDDKEKGEKK